jgi:hypothetical protein
VGRQPHLLHLNVIEHAISVDRNTVISANIEAEADVEVLGDCLTEEVRMGIFSGEPIGISDDFALSVNDASRVRKRKARYLLSD